MGIMVLRHLLANDRSVSIGLRVDSHRLRLIERAADAVGKSRTDFVLDAAVSEALAVLKDRTLFQLESRKFRRFERRLDDAPTENPRLRKLLASKAGDVPLTVEI